MIDRRQFLRRTGMGAGALAMLGPAGLLAACGSDEAATPAASGTGSATSGSAPATLTPLRMQSAWVSDAEFMGYYIALDKGYYSAAGLDYTYLPGGPDVIPETTLLAGQAEVALTTVEGVAKLVADEGAKLKIIGTQYQKNPAGVVSLKANNITEPKDLIGRTLAIAPVGQITFEALFAANNLDIADVTIVPYAYDPTPLLEGEIDASGDFVTNVPFTIQEKGGDPTSFLLYDYGLKLYNDAVVVQEEYLAEHRAELVSFLRASRQGWDENFKDTTAYIPLLKEGFGKDTGRSAANEEYFNKAQQDLIEHPDGVYAMTADDIDANIETLQRFGIQVDASLFDTSLLEEI
ncbi:myristoyl transferase [Nakamurella sp. YIM 132087]|uniref:Thiamine pyrimidine synthase n=1 Tax=Nakamurella alba TaxID=2665158 RepID=A0A7K1FSD3_9ACTN|nr:ABC transporter substrate-binding protein [Nakamurella alba]MTD17052.1 myristoyl transferase [Nakamurella alba]